MTARGATPLIVTLALLSALALVLAAPAAQATRSEFFGITDEPEFNDQDLAALASARVHSLRFPLRWSAVEATEGSYQWDATDRSVGRLASHGIRVAPVLWGSPDWANTGGRQRPPLSATARSAWQRFLEAAVARYGPGGSYWANGYRQQFGAGATPWPVTSWEVWNEPNLKFFDPGGTVKEKVLRYGRLMQISHDAIKAKDPHARLVLAGMAPKTGSGTVDSSTFLGQLYSQVRGFGGDFDVAALHPYAPELDQVRQTIARFRAVLTEHDDQSKPLWITEFGWGSAHLGLAGQAQMLTKGFNLILRNRETWNVQRLVWYRWRDPPPGPELKCHLCSSAGLFAHDRTPKPAFNAYRTFTADATAPTASITKGPAQGALTNNPTPAFAFTSSEAGSTFVCRIDSGALKQCATPFKAPRLSNGPHSFSVKAIDAAGNESATVSRSFRVDTLPPAAPMITATSPASPANDNAPEVKGSAEAGSTVRLFETVGCTGAAAARGPAARFAGQGLTDSVPQNAVTHFRATATDAAGNVSPCSAARTYVEDSVAPADHDHRRPHGLDERVHPNLHLRLLRGEFHLRVPLRLRSLRRLLGPRREPHPFGSAGPRAAHLRGSGLRRRAQYGRDAGQPDLRGHALSALREAGRRCRR